MSSHGQGVRRKAKTAQKNDEKIQRQFSAKANPEVSDPHKYTSTLSKLIERCKENFRAGAARPEVRWTDKKSVGDSFSEMGVQEFRTMLESNVDAQIEDKGQFFRLKQAYPVEDRVQLKQYLLKKGRYGILGDEDFEMCY